MPEQTKRVKRKFWGICADAKTLGVTREHLWYVLTGRRRSRSLLLRYRGLKRGLPATSKQKLAVT